MENNTKQEIKRANLELAATINELATRRVIWEQGAYAASNIELYTLLGACLDIFIQVRSNPNLAKGVNTLLKARNITFNAGTSLELKIVRLVFASGETAPKIENRAFGYARVIRVAFEAKQTGATLPQFIEAHHGIEEIRRSGKDGVSNTNKVELFKEHARTELLASTSFELFSPFELPDQLQPYEGEQFSLALVRKNADGTGSIVFGTGNVAAVSTVLALAGKSIRQEAVKAAEVQFAQTQAQVQQQSIQNVQALLDDQAAQRAAQPMLAQSPAALQAPATLSTAPAVPA